MTQPRLTADWGFACLIEVQGMPPILFDTGASGSILLHNMKQLRLDPRDIGIVVISHPHGDHTGGLRAILEVNRDVELYLPQSLGIEFSGRKITRVKQPLEIRQGVFTTGELGGMEQSLAINTKRGLLVVVGCSHPGVGNILDAASAFGKIYGIIGGFHGFHHFDRLKPLPLICPCHCTQYKSEIMRLFPQQCIKCGGGLVIEL
ncbi:MAG: MBL fold metallo-hydrolase [Dehalococcoidales bacterium]|nr:MBL fold metallo-hydrolase [Dehalococcoidales bacterium]